MLLPEPQAQEDTIRHRAASKPCMGNVMSRR